jgi:hypothetical protein
VLPLISIVILFITIYFLAIDLYHRPKKPFLIGMGVIVLVELFLFGEGDWHRYVEVLLLNGAIVVFCATLIILLQTRIKFSAFSYFTGGGYTLAAILTLFFSVVMMGEYSQLPFSCDDLDGFPQNLFQTDDVVPEEELDVTIIGQKSDFELLFERGKTLLQNQALQLQDSVSKNSCEFVMGKLKDFQINQGFQIAAIVLLYFLLIGVFKIMLWIVSFLAFFLFLLLKPFKVYRYEKKMIEKERIC